MNEAYKKASRTMDECKNLWIMLEDRKNLDFKTWKQKHIDTLIALDESEDDFMLHQAEALYEDCYHMRKTFIR